MGEKEKAKQALEVEKSLSIARHGKINEEHIIEELAKL